jgi:hypothetical protein
MPIFTNARDKITQKSSVCTVLSSHVYNQKLHFNAAWYQGEKTELESCAQLGISIEKQSMKAGTILQKSFTDIVLYRPDSSSQNKITNGRPTLEIGSYFDNL